MKYSQVEYKRRNVRYLNNRSHQSGAVLIVGLILLAVVTMITLSSVKSSTMEERLSSNLRDHNLALQAAEAALRIAEKELDGVLPVFNSSGAYLSQTFNADASTLEFWQTSSNVSTYTKEANVTLVGVNAKPRFSIQELGAIPLEGGSMKFGPVSGNMVYRVTAIGIGGHPDTQVVLQSTFRR